MHFPIALTSHIILTEPTEVKTEVTVTRQNRFPMDQAGQYYAFRVTKRINLTNQWISMQWQVSVL